MLARRSFAMFSLCLLAALMPVGAFAQDAADRAAAAQAASEQAVPAPQARPRPEVEITPSNTVAAPVGNAGLFVGAVTLVGLQQLQPADFADVIAERIGRTLSPADLTALVNAVSARIRARGYPMGYARIDAQRVANGVLIVRANEGVIDEVRIEGAQLESVRAVLEPLRSGRPARLSEVEMRLLIAGDIAGVSIKGSRFFREGDRGILLVRVAYDRVSAHAHLSNRGTRAVGPQQAKLQVDINGVLASDDSLTLNYTTVPFEPRELQSGYMRYSKRISDGGTEIALSGAGSVTRPGADLAARNIRSRTWYVALSALHPVLRRRSSSYWLEAELGVRDWTQWRAGVRSRHDQLAVARMTLSGYRALGSGRLRSSLTLSRGLALFDATGSGDALASRGDADATFTSLGAWGDWTGRLGGNLSLRLAAQGQVASQPLLISEETGLGGTAFLRGYDWGERTGDEGLMGLAELRLSLKDPLDFVTRAQFYAFIDGGVVANHDGGYGGGSLASTGGGVRLDLSSRIGVSLELAVPITGPRYDSQDRSPKINLGIARAF